METKNLISIKIKNVWESYCSVREKRDYEMMKKRIYMITLIFAAGICTGCGKKDVTVRDQSTEIVTTINNETEEQQSNAENKSLENDWKDTIEIDFTYDYSEDIKTDVDHVVSTSNSLQEELENIKAITKKYTPLAEKAETQREMNISSRWLYMIWDTELNDLWKRFCNLADPQTKEQVLSEQRNWVSMKEEVTLLSIGSSEGSGSIYPLLQNSFLEEITKNRSYLLANKLAEIKGETFVMPERSEKYGLFVDNQGTGDVYSSLITRQGIDDKDEVVISVYRQGELNGTFVDQGDGKLIFTSDDEKIKGMIQINGWSGADFQVTEVSGESAFVEGEKVEFPFVF